MRIRSPRTLLLAVACATALSACEKGTPPPLEQIDADRLGHVGFVHPADAPDAFVFLFADTSPALDAAARELADDAGAAVVAVDIEQYRQGLAASDDGCHYLISEIEALSKKLQRQLGASAYKSPILAGVGEGGALVYAALAQSPAATIAGAVSVDPSAAVHTKVSLCPGAPAAPTADGGFRYGAVDKVPGFWRVSSKTAVASDLAKLVTPTEDAPSTGDPQLERLVALVEDSTGEGPEVLRDLPLTEVPADKPGPLMAVIYSGDGGWRDLDKEIGEHLAEQGVPVVGVDSLRYFWRRREPPEIAADLAEILDNYFERWNARRVILIGYSFGAAILPFAIEHLPPPQRERIALVSLLGLEERAEFQFQVEGWLGAEPDDSAPEVVPELVKLDLHQVQCFYGAEEDDSACRDPRLAGAEVIETEGGHHFDGDYDALAQRIYEAARKRLPPES